MLETPNEQAKSFRTFSGKVFSSTDYRYSGEKWVEAGFLRMIGLEGITCMKNPPRKTARISGQQSSGLLVDWMSRTWEQRTQVALHARCHREVPRSRPKCVSVVFPRQRTLHGMRERLFVPYRHEVTPSAVLQYLPRTAWTVRADDRASTGHGLDENASESLVVR